MSEHELKTDAPFFDAVKSGEKKFELRFNDRGFQKGDTLLLKRMDGFALTGELRCKVTYVLAGHWLAPGFVALSIEVGDPMTDIDRATLDELIEKVHNGRHKKGIWTGELTSMYELRDAILAQSAPQTEPPNH